MFDANWLKALTLPLKATFGAAVASSILLVLDWQKLLLLKDFGVLIPPSVLVVAVISWALVLVSLVDLALSPLREKQRQARISTRLKIRHIEQAEARAEYEKNILAKLDHLSKEEIRHVAHCLIDGTQTFYTWAHSSSAGMLVSKGLVFTTHGTHHQDNYPYSFHDFVWNAILARKAEFIAKDEERVRTEKSTRR